MSYPSMGNVPWPQNSTKWGRARVVCSIKNNKKLCDVVSCPRARGSVWTGSVSNLFWVHPLCLWAEWPGQGSCWQLAWGLKRRVAGKQWFFCKMTQGITRLQTNPPLSRQPEHPIQPYCVTLKVPIWKLGILKTTLPSFQGCRSQARTL